MKEEKDILNRDVEIPEVVFRKADAALNQIRANTESTKATRKVTRIQGRIHHVQAAAVEGAVPLIVFLSTEGVPVFPGVL